MRSRDEFRGVSHMWCHYRERKHLKGRLEREVERKASKLFFCFVERESRASRLLLRERERDGDGE